MSFARENETKEVSFSLFFMLRRAVGKVLLPLKRFVFFFFFFFLCLCASSSVALFSAFLIKNLPKILTTMVEYIILS